MTVLKSQDNASRIVVLGEVYDNNGAPVTTVLELMPRGHEGVLIDFNIVTSAYGKDSNPAEFIRKSEVLYITEDKKKADNWFQGVGLQLPSDKTSYGAIGNITYSGEKINISGVPFSDLATGRAPKQRSNSADVGDASDRTINNIGDFSDNVNSKSEKNKNNFDAPAPISPRQFKNGVSSEHIPSVREIVDKNLDPDKINTFDKCMKLAHEAGIYPDRKMQNWMRNAFDGKEDAQVGSKVMKQVLHVDAQLAREHVGLTVGESAPWSKDPEKLAKQVDFRAKAGEVVAVYGGDSGAKLMVKKYHNPNPDDKYNVDVQLTGSTVKHNLIDVQRGFYTQRYTKQLFVHDQYPPIPYNILRAGLPTQDSEDPNL